MAEIAGCGPGVPVEEGFAELPEGFPNVGALLVAGFPAGGEQEESKEYGEVTRDHCRVSRRARVSALSWDKVVMAAP